MAVSAVGNLAIRSRPTPIDAKNAGVFAVLGVLRVGPTPGSTPGSDAQRTLLEALLLDRGEVVSSDRLAELIWGDDQPADPNAALQSHVSRVRRRLPESATIAAEGSGYVLRCDDDLVDAVQFGRHHEAGLQATTAHEQLAAAERALDLWRGTPFPELDDTRASAERARLTEAHTTLVELRAEALVRLGRPQDAIGSLESLLVDEPMRERAVSWLMKAYVMAGRKHDALGAYGRLRTGLLEEAGLDPSPELRALETDIITETYNGEPPQPDRPESAVADEPDLDAVRTTINLPISSFVGRDEDLRSVTNLLGTERIISLVGPGGVGKTRLATHVAAEAERNDEVDLVELAPLRHGEEVPEAIASRLGLQPQADRTPVERVIDGLGSRRRVIVLDNCEHLIEAVARFVEAVVQAAPGVTFLSTSREPLNIDGEAVVRVAPLGVTDAAVQLFLDRARLATNTDIDGEDRPLIERICQALDGLPLAIELAAAQLPIMSLQALHARLDEPLDVLRRGRRTSLDRHRSLRGLIEWSVNDLDPELRDVFAATATFAGPFTADAVALVLDRSSAATESALLELVDRSLVFVELTTPGPATRFVMLETMRSYAGELMEDRGLAERSATAHSNWILGLLDGASTSLERLAEVDAQSIISVHLGDIRVAHRRFLDRDDREHGLRMASALSHPAFFGMHSELFSWIAEAAEKWGASDHPLAESVLAAAGTGAWLAGDLELAAAFSRRAAAASAHSGLGAGRGAAEGRGDVALFSGDTGAAYSNYLEAARLAAAEGAPPRVVTNLCDAALAASYQSNTVDAMAAVTEAREVLGGHDGGSCRAWVDYTEAEVVADSDPLRARELLVNAIAMAERYNAGFVLGAARLTLTGVEMRSGDVQSAVTALIELLVHWRERGARLQQWITLRSAVELLVTLERHHEAAPVLGAILASDSNPEAGTPDARRLADSAQSIADNVSNAADALTEWDDDDLDDIVDRVLTVLDGLKG